MRGYYLPKKSYMSQAIKQLQLRYHNTEDRILLTIATPTNQVMKAWITRRYVKILLPALQGLNPETLKPIVEMTDNLSREDLNYKLENQFNEPENPRYPLGEDPIILNSLRFVKQDVPMPRLALEPKGGSGILLNLYPPFVRALQSQLASAIIKADWQLDLDPMVGFASSHRLQ